MLSLEHWLEQQEPAQFAVVGTVSVGGQQPWLHCPLQQNQPEQQSELALQLEVVQAQLPLVQTCPPGQLPVWQIPPQWSP